LGVVHDSGPAIAKRTDLAEQSLQLHGLGIKVVAARGQRILPIACHRIGGESNNRDALSGRVGFDSPG